MIDLHSQHVTAYGTLLRQRASRRMHPTSDPALLCVKRRVASTWQAGQIWEESQSNMAPNTKCFPLQPVPKAAHGCSSSPMNTALVFACRKDAKKDLADVAQPLWIGQDVP